MGPSGSCGARGGAVVHKEGTVGHDGRAIGTREGSGGTQRELCGTKRVWLGWNNVLELRTVTGPTVEQLIDEDEVVLDILLADLAEVRLHDADDLQEELEHHRRVHVLLRDGGQPDVGALDVEEAGACDVRDGRTHLLARMDHVHSERVDGIPPVEERSRQAFMQRPVHPSYGRVKQNVDGCLFVWMGKKIKKKFELLCIRPFF